MFVFIIFYFINVVSSWDPISILWVNFYRSVF